MEALLKTLNTLADVWGYLLGAVALGVAGIASWRRFSAKARRLLCFSDNLYDHFGDNDSSKKLLQEITRTGRETRIRETRQQIVESKLGISIYITTPEGHCEFANTELCELFGLDREAMTGFGWLEAVAPEQRNRVHEIWQYSIKNRLPYENSYDVVNHRTKARFSVVTRAYPVFDSNEKLICYVGTVIREPDHAEKKT